MAPHLRLYHRRVSNTHWAEIGPGTTEGRRLLALFTHPKERTTMTTTAARITRPSTVIHDPETGDAWVSTPEGNLAPTAAVAGGGILSRVGGFFRGIWNSIKSGWASVKRSLHLDAVTDKVKAAYQWARAKVSAGMRFLGTDGLLGLGMLSISTHGGRKVIRFVLSPALWLVRKAGTGWVWVESMLRNEKPGGLRNWVADKMGSARVWLVGTPDGEKDGIVMQFIHWCARTFGRHLMVDSLFMRTLRAVGTFLLGRKLMFAALAAFPAFAALPLVTPVAWVLFGLTVLLPFNPEIQGFNDRMQARMDARALAKITKNYEEKVEAAVKEAGAEVKADQAEAAAQAKKDLEVDAKSPTAAALATGKVVAQNRTQKRTAAARKTAAARR